MFGDVTYNAPMIHMTQPVDGNLFAELYGGFGYCDEMLYFTYDPVVDGHFNCEMEQGGPMFARELLRNAPGDFRTIAVGDTGDPSLGEHVDDVVGSIVGSERVLRDLFTHKPKQHTVVYIEEPAHVILHRTGTKTPTETVVASEVNRGLLAALLAQNPKDTGVSIVLCTKSRSHPCAHLARRHLVSARERYGHAYEQHIHSGWLSVPGEKDQYQVRLVGTYEEMGKATR